MGKKTKKEREEERESFAAKRSREKRKSFLMAAGIFGIIAVIVGYSVIVFLTMPSAPGAPPGAGTLGDEHDHISLLVRIFGDRFDFSSPAYQIKSSWIHFEGADGNTIHRHSSGVKMGYLFGTLGLELTDECFVFKDGRDFCTNEDYSLKFYINHDQVDGNEFLGHVGQEDDRVLISYGNETPEEIEEQLREVDAQIVVR